LVVLQAHAADVIDSFRGFVWFGLAAIVIWRLFPVIRKRFESGDLSFKLFGQEMTVSEASERLHVELDDLRSKVIELSDRLQPADEAPEEPDERPVAPVVDPQPPPAANEVTHRPPRILWVDDHPQNNTFLVESLRRDQNADVSEATSTDEALEKLAADPGGFDVVISDMGRQERGGFRALAGVDLLRRMRDQGFTVPVVIYASSDAVSRGGHAAVEAGAVEVTASPTELLSLLRIGPTTEFEASVAEILRRDHGATVFPIYRSVDFVAVREGERVGIEIKNWSHTPTPERFDHALQLLRNAHERHRFDRILMITRQGVDVPEGIDLPDWLTVQTVDDVVATSSNRR
jgi:CheY-like chemotaxis protein